MVNLNEGAQLPRSRGTNCRCTSRELRSARVFFTQPPRILMPAFYQPAYRISPQLHAKCALSFLFMQCSVTCGTGVRTRTIECRDGVGAISRDCDPAERPHIEQECKTNVACSTCNCVMSELNSRRVDLTRYKRRFGCTYGDIREIGEPCENQRNSSSGIDSQIRALPPS